MQLDDVRNVEMDIKLEPPPNADDIEQVFPGVTNGVRPILFCYGHSIYNPAKIVIPLQLIAHEAVHALQQDSYGAKHWWDMYLHGKLFRLDQEAPAHRIENEAYREHNNRAMSRAYRKDVARRLASPLYGSLISVKKAMELL